MDPRLEYCGNYIEIRNFHHSIDAEKMKIHITVRLISKLNQVYLLVLRTVVNVIIRNYKNSLWLLKI